MADPDIAIGHTGVIDGDVRVGHLRVEVFLALRQFVEFGEKFIVYTLGHDDLRFKMSRLVDGDR